jgi:hypothetical protein
MMQIRWLNRENLIRWGFNVTSLIIVGILGLVFYWLVIDRDAPVIIHDGKAINYERQPDGSWIFFVKRTGERKRSCSGLSKRWIANTALLPLEDIPYPPDAEDRPLGPYEWEVPVQVPAYYASTGHVKGTYRIRILYACNPLQEYFFPIVVEPPPVPFELPLEGQPGGGRGHPGGFR